MKRLLAVPLLLLLVAPASRAQEGPERLLSAGTQLYFRSDGIERNKAAFEKSAIGQILGGDTGTFLKGLLAEIKPDHFLKLARGLADHGFAVGFEARSFNPEQPDLDLIAVLPNAKVQWEPLFGSLRFAVEHNRGEVKETEVMKRTIYHVTGGPPSLVWWKEGNDAVIALGTDAPEALVKRILGKTPRITENALYKQVTSYNDFPTAQRGFVDIAALVKLARNANPMAPKIIDELGLSAFQSFRFYQGFEGPALRTLLVADISGTRKGLARLANGTPFTLEDLPALPADAVSFTALRCNLGALFDGAVQICEGLVPAEQVPAVKGAVGMANQALGIDIRNDLLGSLGDLLVTYSSPPEGALFFGQTLLLQVKDAKKLEATLAKAIPELGKVLHAKIELKSRTFRGAKLNTVRVNERGFILAPTYTVTKDWLALGLFPQPVQGYVMRSSGELPTWKPSAAVKASLAKLPNKVTMLSITDPRPGVNAILSLAPIFAAGIQSELRDSSIDLSGLPNAHTITRHLFPNVTVCTDNGKIWRLQSLDSLPMPPGLGSLDSTVAISMGAITFMGRSAQAEFKMVGKELAPPAPKEVKKEFKKEDKD